jgi:glycosyltransferase involved in cell wall biosynthesis
VLFCYNAHHNKGAPLALEVLRRLHQRRPEVEIVGFGALEPDHPLPDWITYHRAPDQTTLVDDLYNGSRIFLWTSTVEGFGLPALEAMACGAALVTTDNGGSEDYAFAEETALVSQDHEAGALLHMVERLLDHDDDRIRIASAGRRLAAGFTWDRSADRLEQLLEDYAADPRRYGRPG